MSGSLFESLVRNSMTLITDIDESESMVVHEGDMFARAETSEDPKFKLEINDKDVILEELEELMRYPRLRTVKMLYLDENSFEDAGVEKLAGTEALHKLNTLSLAGNKLTAKGMRALAASPHLKNLRVLFLQHNQLGPEAMQALAESETLANLNFLYLKANPL